MNLVVVGCGKMGLPIAALAASKGIDVVGVDVNEQLVSQINKGVCPINEPGLEPLLQDAVSRKKLSCTTDLKEAVPMADAVIVIVPVSLTSDNEADLSIIRQVTRDIATVLTKGTVVSYETTLPIGTVRNVFLPILETSGLKADEEFFLVYSPERVKSLKVFDHLNNVPKVVGGLGVPSLKKGVELYRAFLDCTIEEVTTLEEAEMVKLAGMIYRDVNIALANQLSHYCEQTNIDLSRILPAVNTDGEAHLLSPGIGVGGHCTPVYPYFLINDARARNVPQTLAENSRVINDNQAVHAIKRAEELVDFKAATILLLGLGFRPDVKEDSYSTAYLLKTTLEEKGVTFYLHDPLYSHGELVERGFDPAGDIYSEGRCYEVVILVTAHSDFMQLDWARLKANGTKVVVDGRNCLSKELLEFEDLTYLGIG